MFGARDPNRFTFATRTTLSQDQDLSARHATIATEIQIKMILPKSAIIFFLSTYYLLETAATASKKNYFLKDFAPTSRASGKLLQM